MGLIRLEIIGELLGIGSAAGVVLQLDEPIQGECAEREAKGVRRSWLIKGVAGRAVEPVHPQAGWSGTMAWAPESLSLS